MLKPVLNPYNEGQSIIKRQEEIFEGNLKEALDRNLAIEKEIKI